MMKQHLVRMVVGTAITALVMACQTTNYYIVRHAEKVDDSLDPPLTEQGETRARTLSDTLRHKGIDQIFTSQRQRTRQTAAPTAARFGLTPTQVLEANTPELVTALRAIGSGKNVLVVWHSGNVHTVVNALVSPTDAIAPIGDHFDNLFHVQRQIILGQRKTKLYKQKYGAPH